MKILVTGGAGFIGSHIVDAYVAKGHKVAVMDNLSTGFRKNLNPKARFYRADIEDPKAVQAVMRKERPQVVSHHAASMGVVKSFRDPLSTLAANVLGTANVLAAFGELPRSPRRKFVFASTGTAMYSGARNIPASEKTPASPLSPYGLSKKMAEDLVRFCARQMGFDHLIFRYGNVYGPRQNPKGEMGVVAIFAGLLRSGGRPVIFGDGRKTRDYVYIDDVVRANVIALTKGRNIELNLGCGHEISDREVFDAIARRCGYDKEPRHASHREGEIRRVALDSGKARRILGWAPKTSFEKGIAMTLRRL